MTIPHDPEFDLFHDHQVGLYYHWAGDLTASITVLSGYTRSEAGRMVPAAEILVAFEIDPYSGWYATDEHIGDNGERGHWYFKSIYDAQHFIHNNGFVSGATYPN